MTLFSRIGRAPTRVNAVTTRLGCALTLVLILCMAWSFYGPTRIACADANPEEPPSDSQEEKRTVPTPSKHVRTTPSEDAWASHVCAGIGDVVTYRLEASLPTDLASYKGYQLWFCDELDEGLAYVEESVRSFVEHADSNSDKVQLTTTFEGRSMRVGTDNILAEVPGLLSTDVVVVEYDCVVLPKAPTGLVKGSQNEVYLTYTRDHEYTVTGKSVTQTASVHSLGIELHKVDESDGAVLAGACFVLQNGKGQYRTDSGSWSERAAEAQVLTTSSQGIAKFTGVGEGTYTITETKAPEGYETLKDPVVVTLAASDMETSKRTLSATVKDDHTELVSVQAGEGVAVIEVQNSKVEKKNTPASTNNVGGNTNTSGGRTSDVVRAIDSVLPTTVDKLVALGGGMLVAAVTMVIAGMAVRRSRTDSHDG